MTNLDQENGLMVQKLDNNILAQPNPTPIPQKTSQPQASTLGRKICLLIFIAILVLALIGIVVFLIVYFLVINKQSLCEIFTSNFIIICFDYL